MGLDSWAHPPSRRVPATARPHPQACSSAAWRRTCSRATTPSPRRRSSTRRRCTSRARWCGRPCLQVRAAGTRLPCSAAQRPACGAGVSQSWPASWRRCAEAPLSLLSWEAARTRALTRGRPPACSCSHESGRPHACARRPRARGRGVVLAGAPAPGRPRAALPAAVHLQAAAQPRHAGGDGGAGHRAGAVPRLPAAARRARQVGCAAGEGAGPACGPLRPPAVAIASKVQAMPHAGSATRPDRRRQRRPRPAPPGAGAQLGAAHLFFGCRNRAHDFIYQEELQGAVSQGAVSQVRAGRARGRAQAGGRLRASLLACCSTAVRLIWASWLASQGAPPSPPASPPPGASPAWHPPSPIPAAARGLQPRPGAEAVCAAPHGGARAGAVGLPLRLG